MKIKFIKHFRDADNKDQNGKTKFHAGLTVAEFPATKAKRLIKEGFAIEVKDPKKKEDKNGKPKGIEKK